MGEVSRGLPFGPIALAASQIGSGRSTRISSESAIMQDESSEQDVIIRYLALYEVPCPRCEYNLHALTVPRCPECGEQVHLRVMPRQSGARAWVAMMLAAATLWGPGVCLLALILIHDRVAPPRGWCLAAYFLAGVGVCMLLLFTLLRRRIVGRPSERQRGWVRLCWIVAAVVWVVCICMTD
jgi:hypothetical protein